MTIIEMVVPAPNHRAIQWTTQRYGYSAAWLPMLIPTKMIDDPAYPRANLRLNKASRMAACSTAAIFARLLEGDLWSGSGS